MKATTNRYRCDICQGVSAPEYVRGWIRDGDGEKEVEPHEAAVKHVCLVCEVRGVYYLGLPPVSALAQHAPGEPRESCPR